MSRWRFLIVLMLAASAAGCGATAPAKPGSPVTSGRIAVREFDMTGVAVTSYEAPTAGFGVELAQKVAEQLNAKGLQAEAVARGASASGAYVVDGRITKIDGGSRAARYWVGFGAGGTELIAKGRVVGPDGQTVGEFSDGRRSGFGMFGGDTEALMHKCVESVADDIADMIKTGGYENNAP